MGEAAAKEEGSSLKHWEGVIQSHETDFWKVGEALINIKVNKLWREEISGKPYKTWEDYLEQAWGYASRARQLMEAAKVHSTLIDAGMSEEEFKRLVPGEAQAKKLSKAKALTKDEAVKFVAAISKEGAPADISVATKALEEIKPPKPKPNPSELSQDERRKSLEKALEKAKSSFESKIDAAFEEYGEPEFVDSWLKSFAEGMLERLSKS